MDTSSEYILMCEKAVEIQEQRMDREHSEFPHKTAKKGDWFQFTDPHSTIIRMTGDDTPDEAVTGIYINGDGTVQSAHIPDRKQFLSFISGYKEVINLIWLPQQDQLQAMLPFAVGNFNDNFWSVLGELNEWAFRKKFLEYIPLSMEQLLLAFVMFQKFNKKWNGEDWIANT